MGTGDPQKEPLGTEANDEEALWALEGRVVRWHLSRLELYSPHILSSPCYSQYLRIQKGHDGAWWTPPSSVLLVSL